MSGGVEVAAFSSETEARVCVSYLQAHGVDAEIANAMTMSVLPFISLGRKAYRVMAPADEAELARDLLAAVGEGGADDQEETS